MQDDQADQRDPDRDPDSGERSHGWIAAAGVTEIVDELILDDISLVEEITHPIRSGLLHRLRRPRSASELAEEMKVPVTRLYHHLNRLEELGLIVVAATRQSGARTERRYRNVAKGYRIDPDLTTVDGAAMGRTMLSLFDVVKTEMRRELELGTVGADSLKEKASLMSVSGFNLTDEQRDVLIQRLRDLDAEFTRLDEANHDVADARRVRVFTAIFELTD